MQVTEPSKPRSGLPEHISPSVHPSQTTLFRFPHFYNSVMFYGYLGGSRSVKTVLETEREKCEDAKGVTRFTTSKYFKMLLSQGL